MGPDESDKPGVTIEDTRNDGLHPAAGAATRQRPRRFPLHCIADTDIRSYAYTYNKFLTHDGTS